MLFENFLLTGELLRVNDDLLNSFVRYDRFERQRRAQAGGGASDDERFSSAPPTYENAATLVSVLFVSDYLIYMLYLLVTI